MIFKWKISDFKIKSLVQMLKLESHIFYNFSSYSLRKKNNWLPKYIFINNSACLKFKNYRIFLKLM